MTPAAHGLSGRLPLADALAGYESTRNELAAGGDASSIQLAHLAPPPAEMQTLLGALLHNQEQTNRFMGTFAGTVPAAEFYAPENVARIVGEPANDGAARAAARDS